MNDTASNVTKLPANNPDSLLELAITKGADVDSLAKLMDLKDRHEAKLAKHEFDIAMSNFQASCPAIEKTKTVKFNQTEYSYAPLSSIKEQIQVFLTEFGLSYRWEIDDTAEIIKVTCILSHVSGHSEKTTMSALADDSGSKNQIQQRGSTLTYCQRYTLIGALGLTSADTDDDGRASGALNTEILIAQSEAFRKLYKNVYTVKQGIEDGDLQVAAEAWYELSNDEKTALWVAPTKGGLFTTAEREVMKSTEFRQSHYGENDEGN